MSNLTREQTIQSIIKRLSTNLQLDLPLAEVSDRIKIAKEIQSFALAKGFTIPLHGCWQLLQALAETYKLEHLSQEKIVALAVLIIEQIEFDKRIAAQRYEHDSLNAHQ